MASDRAGNNFDFIRFLAATGVIITHSYPLTGTTENDDILAILTNGLFTFSSLGVDAFFIISGYLIAKSIEQSPTLRSYFWKRALRIFPALIVVVLLSVFVLGPLVTAAPSGVYLTHPYTYAYISTITLYKISYVLPGVFGDNPYRFAVNGSLWTLPYEFTFYIILAMVIFVFRRSGKIFLISLIAGLLMFRIYAEFSPDIFSMRNAQIANMSMDYLLHFAILFGIGSGLYFFRESIPLNKKIFFVAAAALLMAALLRSTWGELYLIKYVALPYALIYLALLKSKLNSFGKYGDFSYGMYIYAFPVQQTIMYLSGSRTVPPMVLAALSVAFTLPLAILSWKLIESKALSLKNRIGSTFVIEEKKSRRKLKKRGR